MELERKFLLADAAMLSGREGRVIDQIYPLVGERFAARIRLRKNSLVLNVKSRALGSAREEYEAKIRLSDVEANDIRAAFDRAELRISKTRYDIEFAPTGSIGSWTIDVFHVPTDAPPIVEFEVLGSLVDAVGVEEAKRMMQAIQLPPFCGREITFDPAYRNEEIARRDQRRGTIGQS